MRVCPPSSVVWLLTATTVWSGVEVNPADASGPEALERGRQIVFEPSKGNCPACHQIAGAETPGDLGPPLVAIRARFPNRVALRRQLWDPLENNPRSRMPPFGRHRILTEDELDRVVDYIYSL